MADEKRMTISEALKEKGETTGEGDYVPMADLLDSQVLITGISDSDGEYGPGLRLEVLQDGREMVTLTSSKVLVEKFNKVRDMLPLYATIYKRKGKSGRSYYDVK